VSIGTQTGVHPSAVGSCKGGAFDFRFLTRTALRFLFFRGSENNQSKSWASTRFGEGPSSYGKGEEFRGLKPPPPKEAQSLKRNGEMNSPLQGQDAASGLGAPFLRQDELKRRPYTYGI
jgi:hypothetical protein